MVKALALLPITITPLMVSNYSYDYFNIPKWDFYFFCFFLLGSLLLFTKKIYIPKIPNLDALCFLSIFAVTTLISIFLASGQWSHILLYRISFIIYVFIFFQLFKSEKINLITLTHALQGTSLFLILLGVVFHISQESSLNLASAQLISATLGNSNLFAEFLGLTLLVSIYSHTKSHSKVTLLGWGIVSAIAIYLAILQCRSVNLFVILGLLWSTFSFSGKNRIKTTLISLILCISFVYKFKKSPLPTGHVNSVSDIKLQKQNQKAMGSIEARWAIAMASLDHIYHHPLGVGSNQFEFSILPYLAKRGVRLPQKSLWFTPHNEFLKLLIEEGILVTTGLMVLLIGMLIFIWKRIEKPDQTLFEILTLFFLGEALFQFPLESAHTVLLMAVSLSYFLGLLEATEVKNHSLWPYPLGIALVIIWGTSIYSHLQTNGKNRDTAKLAKACHIYPENWRACTHLSYVLISQKKYIKASEILTPLLESTPFNTIALRNISLAKLNAGEKKSACMYMSRYQKLFLQNDMTKLFKKNCTAL